MSAFIAFVAPPYAGHLNPIVRMAEWARDAGYRVEILTGPSKVETIQRLGLPAECPSVLASGVLEKVADTNRPVRGNLIGLHRQLGRSLAMVRPVRDHLMARWQGDRPDLVVADFVAVPAGLASTALDLPWITTMRPPFVMETWRGPPSYLGGLSPLPGPLGRLRDKAGWALIRGMKDLLTALYSRHLSNLGFRRLRADGTETIYSPHAILSTTMQELEFSTDWPSHVTFLGAETTNPEQAPPVTLPEERPRVLVTAGTHVPWAKPDMVRQIKGLSRRIPEAMFVISLGDATQSAIPEPIEVDGRVRVHGFVPYRPELPRFDAVIHHGGAGIVYSTIEAGLPSLVWPQDFDQFDMAARVQHHGLGHWIRRLDSDRTATLLRRILSAPPPAVARFKESAGHYRPRERFLEVADSLLPSTADKGE